MRLKNSNKDVRKQVMEISSFAGSGMFKKVFVPHHLNVTDTLSKLFKLVLWLKELKINICTKLLE